MDWRFRYIPKGISDPELIKSDTYSYENIIYPSSKLNNRQLGFRQILNSPKVETTYGNTTYLS